MKLKVAWGSKQWTSILWPHEQAPEWANTAAKRMQQMGLSGTRINEVLQEMRNNRVNNTVYKLEDREYDIIFE